MAFNIEVKTKNLVIMESVSNIRKSFNQVEPFHFQAKIRVRDFKHPKSQS